MSSRPQPAPIADFIPPAFEVKSSVASRSKLASGVLCPAVMLVGRNGSWGSAVLKSVSKCESDFSYVAPEKATPEFAKNGAYTLILLDSTVTPEQRRQLAFELAGTRTSIFYSFPVENGCWWLPALRRGRDCHGTPAFRRSEFPREIERILQDQSEEPV